MKVKDEFFSDQFFIAWPLLVPGVMFVSDGRILVTLTAGNITLLAVAVSVSESVNKPGILAAMTTPAGFTSSTEARERPEGR